MDAIKWGLIILLILIMGCAVTTTITDPHGETWTVVSKKDALVKLERAGTKLEVDNRGKMSWIEGLMQYILAKPEIKLSNKEGN